MVAGDKTRLLLILYSFTGGDQPQIIEAFLDISTNEISVTWFTNIANVITITVSATNKASGTEIVSPLIGMRILHHLKLTCQLITMSQL